MFPRLTSSCYNQNMKIRHLVLLFTIILITSAAFGCGGGGEPKTGDKVTVHYTGTLDDGSVFDSSRGKEPLEFVIGAGQTIAGFDKAVRGMKVGETKTVKIPPKDAYGEYDEDLVIKVDRNTIPENYPLNIGDKIPLQSNKGDSIIAEVTDITEDYVICDRNHKLAGKTLTFEIELLSIEPAN
jgi:peptidylprolyl isomerase